MPVQRIGNRWEVSRAGEPPVNVSISRSGLKFLVSGADVITFDSREQADAFAESVAEECNGLPPSLTQLFGKALDDYSDNVRRAGWRLALKRLNQPNDSTEE